MDGDNNQLVGTLEMSVIINFTLALTSWFQLSRPNWQAKAVEVNN